MRGKLANNFRAINRRHIPLSLGGYSTTVAAARFGEYYALSLYRFNDRGQRAQLHRGGPAPGMKNARRRTFSDKLYVHVSYCSKIVLTRINCSLFFLVTDHFKEVCKIIQFKFKTVFQLDKKNERLQLNANFVFSIAADCHRKSS